MIRKILKGLGILLSIVFVAVAMYLGYLAHGITGYASKNLASGVFVSGREQQSIEKEDIGFFPVNWARSSVDFDKKEVTSRFLIWKSKVIYNEGLGCTLVNDFSEDAVRKLDYPKIDLIEVNQDTIPWPAGNLLTDTVPKGINKQEIEELLNQVFADTMPYKGTFAAAVVYRDQLIAERYRSDLRPSTKLLSWSVAKSFTNAMVGLLVKEGKVDVNKPLELKEWAGDERKNITIGNLLHMNSGLEFNEEYSKVMLTDVTTMLTKKGDMAAYAASKKQLFKPDSIWNYSGGSTNIIEDYLHNFFTNEEEYLAFPRKALFSRIGMESAVFEPDASGTFVGSSYIYATARDYARFGMLYLHNGNWLGEQLLPEDWVKYTITPAKGSDRTYGAHFWINSSGKYPGVPSDLFYCDGYDGQFIYIIPSKQLVVVRNGFSPGDMFNEKTFLKRICDAVR
jgi:CubicO group peptidase (beta-lactamase class C family)